MNEEFKTLLAAYNDTHNKWMGAMGLHNALHEHLGTLAQRASRQHQDELEAAHRAASDALDAYMQRTTGFDTTAYEQQQRTTGHLQAA